MALLLLLLGIAALLAGSELIVGSATRLAARLQIPPIVVGLTVVSIGTSTPEFAVGIRSGLEGVGELAVGTIAGTNIVNLLLIFGMSALIRPLSLRRHTVRVDLPLMALAALAAVVLSLDGTLSALNGVLLLAIAGTYTAVVLAVSHRRRRRWVARSGTGAEVAAETSRSTVLELLLLLAGLVVIVLGAEWLVHGAVELALQLGVSDELIGLTIIAIGTSAPELATTLVSTVRGERDVAIGNLIGSSVYNLGLILGVTALVAPGGVRLSEELVTIDLPVMAAVVLLCIPVFVSGRRVRRLEAALFVACYLAYLGFVLATRL